MKCRLPLGACLAWTLALAGCVSTGTPIDVEIIGFDDDHGNLQSPGRFAPNAGLPAAQRVPVGGAQ